jgi:hypothetical protein
MQVANDATLPPPIETNMHAFKFNSFAILSCVALMGASPIKVRDSAVESNRRQ